MRGEGRGTHESSHPTQFMQTPMDSVSSSTLFHPPQPGGLGYSSQEQASNHDLLSDPTYFQAIGHDSTGPPFAASSATHSSSHVIDDPGDQPFVITPEYEAMANAQFEEALRTGARQASMPSPGFTSHANVGDSSSTAHGAVYQTHYFAGQTNTTSPSTHAATSSSHGAVPLETYYDYTRTIPYGAHMNEPTEDTTNDPSYSSASRSYDQHAPGSQPSSDRWYGT